MIVVLPMAAIRDDAHPTPGIRRAGRLITA
jgi:hypothetical protein